MGTDTLIRAGMQYRVLIKPRGFTLIELMIVVAVIGILAAIAYPSYQEQVRKSRRADAQGALMGFANAMERQFTLNGNYCNAGGAGGADDCGDGGNDTGSPSQLPFVFSNQSPLDGGTPYYLLTISAMNAAGTTYTLSAAPTGPQTGDRCGTLTLTQAGVKGITGASAGLVWDDCWRR